MPAAIYYHPEAYTTTGPKLMGRHAAGESFLRAHLHHSQAAEWWIQVDHPDHAKQFENTVRSLNCWKPIQAIDKTSTHRLENIGNVYYPGPGLAEFSFQRSLIGHQKWSLCGITHTTSSSLAMDSIAALLTAPVQPWDALICTSTAVKKNVETLITAQAEYLRDRLGAVKFPTPQLPVIPLGVHCDDFVFSDDERKKARRLLGATDQTIIVLFMGRLSFHAKAHPLAMYQALQKVSNATKKEIMLIECGWHANEFIKTAFKQASDTACPSVKTIQLDGRQAELRKIAWSSSDIFCSLSDNIQETFGITPVEAMAAGLPVVVSDWNGYKDTVEHGKNGFLIPTLMPQAGLGSDLALRHALGIDSYDQYCGYSCSLISVDVEATAEALSSLVQSETLRKTMGEAGRKRARDYYDWTKVMPTYEALWNELNNIRAKAKDVVNTQNVWPARLDPFYSFSNYPTSRLTPSTLLSLVDEDEHLAIKRWRTYQNLSMVNYAKNIWIKDSEIESIFNAASSKPVMAETLLKNIAPDRKPYALRSLAWLLKMGLLKTHL